MLMKYIPKILQNALFGPLIFTLVASKKTRNRMGYYSPFSKQPTRKSNRPKQCILKDLGYTAFLTMSFMLAGCTHKGPNPIDPYEPFNRRVHAFNMAIDKAALKPAAIAYKSLVPATIRMGINNAYNNLDLIPTIGNDLLQAEGKWAIRDSWRLFINSTLGIGGLLDVAKRMGLPPHSNDLGLTFARWGDTKSPYVVLPFLGPSTIRDGSGWLFQFFLYSPYVYLNDNTLMYGLLGLRYVDLRAQLLETDPFIREALDPYAFIRDAYLQHRQYLITGDVPDTGTLPPAGENQDAGVGNDYVDE